MTTWTTTIQSPVAPLLLAATAQPDGSVALRGLWFVDCAHVPDPTTWRTDTAPFVAISQQLQAFFEHTRTTFDVPLDPQGTEFQQQVWRELREIPYGSTTSYAHIARRVGRPAAVRAVGMAIGRNPISIVVPCHRVVGSNGQLTGYAGGLDAKRWLLRHEGALPAALPR